jgi:hypothetical protein
MFLKGLAVVGNVAYFSESEFSDRRGREKVQCALVAVDLVTKKLVFYRSTPGSIGLINAISLLGVQDATYKAQESFPNQIVAPYALCAEATACKSTLDFAKTSGYAYGRFPRVDITQLPFVVDSLPDLLKDIDRLVNKVGLVAASLCELCVSNPRIFQLDASS